MHTPSAPIGYVWMIFLIRELRATITVGPSNTVASIGEQVKLDCSANMVIAYWYFSKNGAVADEVQITQVACMGLSPEFTDHYAVESMGGGTTCNLIVANITMEQAGVYRCQEGSSQALSILTVTDSFSTLTYNNTPDVIEGENVVFTCSVNYNGSVSPSPTLRPHYYWTDVNGQNVSGFIEQVTEKKVVSEKSVTAGRQDIASHTCHLYLELDPPSNGGYANNTPTVNNRASSPPIAVFYAPLLSNILATPSRFSDCQAMNLECYSDANPSPNYNWMDNIYGNVTNAQNITAEYGVNYTCTASNVIRNDVYASSSSFYEATIANNTCKFPWKTNMQISGELCNEDACTCECHPATIFCHVSSYPPSSYEWLFPDGSRVEGQSVQAKISGIFVCRSYTLIDGWYLVEAYKSVNVSGCDFALISTTLHSTQTPPTTTSLLPPMLVDSSAELTAAIVLGVLLAISIAFNTICMFLLYRKGIFKPRDSSKSDVNIPTKNSEEGHYQDLCEETLAAKPEYEELSR